MFKKILITTDFSEAALEVISTVAELFPLQKGREYHLLHVVPHLAGVTPVFGNFSIQNTLYENAQKEMAALIEESKIKNIHLIPHVLKGEVEATLVSFLKDYSMDLIALSTHARKGVERFFLGSVAEKIIRAASCPVLTFKPSHSV